MDRRAVGSSSISESLRLGRVAEMFAHARNAEQAMPPGPTLDWVGRLQERERPATVTLINAEPRSLSARSARPPKSRAASPAFLACRNVKRELLKRVMDEVAKVWHGMLF
jgi:hypothetical protein